MLLYIKVKIYKFKINIVSFVIYFCIEMTLGEGPPNKNNDADLAVSPVLLIDTFVEAILQI